MRNNILLIIYCLFLYSCTPQGLDNKVGQKTIEENKDEKTYISEINSANNQNNNAEVIENSLNKQTNRSNKTILVVLPSEGKYKYISDSFINTLEIAFFDLNNNSITFNFSSYENKKDLESIFLKHQEANQIFIGPLTSEDTSFINKFCKKNIIIFSFASDRSLAKDCIYLFNFFIEDDLRTIFNFLDEDSRVALLYPNNKYGNYVNSIIEDFSKDSSSILIYKLSYKEDLSDIRSIIKQLGKYEYRKNELKRQKNILKKKKDEISIASLKKLEKFETIGEIDFSHLIISDGNIRILELAPLLPFYDIDPERVGFIGTGLWDERSFFDEPSLQGAMFPGIEESNRINFINKYIELYHVPPPRIATLMYDLSSLINYLLKNFNDVEKIKTFLDKDNNFFGLDGGFSIQNNIVKRNLSILKIKDGKANSIN